MPLKVTARQARAYQRNVEPDTAPPAPRTRRRDYRSDAARPVLGMNAVRETVMRRAMERMDDDLPIALKGTTMPMTAVSTLIKNGRKARDLTLRELAAQVGVSVPHVHDIETGKRCGSAALLKRIAAVLGYPSYVIRDAYERDARDKLNAELEREWGPR